MPPDHKKPNRIVIYSKDVMNITGLKERAAAMKLQKLRIAFDMPKRAPVTIRDYCIFYCMSEDEVRDAIQEYY